MADIFPDEGEAIDARFDAWRTRALDGLLIAACILWAPAAIPGLLGQVGLPRTLWLAAACIYLLLLLAAVFRRWGLPRRGWLMAIVFYSAASVTLANRGLVGFGRVGLAVLPLMVAPLFGARASWAAGGVSLGIYGVFTALASLGILQRWGIATADPTTPGMWAAQGLGLAMAMAPALVLLNYAHRHQLHRLHVERRLSTRLHEEATRSTVAYHSLRQEQAQRKKLEQRIAQLGEEERKELGREIHDGLCQQLTAALLHFTALQEQLSAENRPEAAQAVRLGLLLQETLDSAYEISKGVWPIGPSPDDLAPALEALARRTSEQFPLQCSFRHEANHEVLDEETAMHVYRIAREAVANAVKHSNASSVSILLVQDADGLVLTVADDGRGLPDAADRDGMGLGIMSYRARAVGGTLTVACAEGGGTTIRCVVPPARDASLEGARHGD